MEEKYYTPSPEEFHLGFEFEAKKGSGLINDVHYEEGQEWKKTIVQHGDFFNTLNPEHIRVKHLGREDIQSLSWKYNYNPSLNKKGSPTEFVFGKAALLFFEKENKVHIFDGISDVVRFAGKLKNKSELKRVMQQVGII